MTAADHLLGLDERAAVRAYLQRSEVRLSTMHRIATALLSGAGLMVLLPAIERDAVVDVLRTLMTGPFEISHAIVAAGIGVMLTLPFTVLWMVLRDLIHFYFHSNHVSTATGDVFTPRFTLTGLRLPAGELGPESFADLEAERSLPGTIELLVPSNDRSRAAIDQRIIAYDGLGLDVVGLEGPVGLDGREHRQGLTDSARADALFTLASSRHRTLLNEVAKVEHGMARHVLRTQTLVLRYVKALLVFLTTAMAAFATAAVVAGKQALAPGDVVWLGAVLILWTPVAVVAVTAPIRWLDQLLRAEGATRTAVVNDRELTLVELLAIRLALVAFALGLVAVLMAGLQAHVASSTRTAALAIAVVGVFLVAMALRRWAGSTAIRRLVGRGTTSPNSVS